MGLVLLVRHGQASFGADDYDVLSETGWEQGRLLGAWLREAQVAPDAVVRGGMRRHRETAEAAGWTDAETDAGWDEFDHLSVVESYPDVPDRALDRREFQRVFELATARWSGGAHDGEYAEPWPAFRARVRASFAAAAARAGQGRTAVVVSSGGPIAAVCAELVDPEADDATYARLWSRLNTVLVNSSLTRVVVGSTGARLLTFNEHPHLTPSEVTYR
jgi:broad specificity phosphatase PhoE